MAEIGGGVFVQHFNRLVGEIADVLITETRGIGAVALTAVLAEQQKIYGVERA